MGSRSTPQDELERRITEHALDEAIWATRDLAHPTVMHLVSRALADVMIGRSG